MPDFPRNIPGNAKNKFSAVYAKLRNDLKNNRKKYEDFKICSNARTAPKKLRKNIGVVKKNSFTVFKVFSIFFKGKCFKVHMNPIDNSVICIEPSIGLLQEEVDGKILSKKKLSSNPMIMKYRDKISAMSDILITEDFLKGIFGEEFWNILAHYNMEGFYDSGLSVDFDVFPYNKGFKVSYSFENTLRGNRTEDTVTFRDKAKKWERIDFNHINFVFFYDPEKDEISHVRFQGRLILNDELITWGDDLLIVDEDDLKRPSSFWLEV